MDPVDSRLGRRMTAAAATAMCLIGVLDATSSGSVAAGYALPVLIASVAASVGTTGVFAAGAVAAAVTSGLWHESPAEDWASRVLLGVLMSAMCVVSAAIRDSRESRLRRMTMIAEAAQRAVLRALPHKVGQYGFAARYLSATEDARVGGDLYEVADTPSGARVIVGDVRGHGMAAVQLAALVLGAFRHAAFTEPDLASIARDLDRVVAAAGGDEDFVTAVLAEFRPDGTVALVSCGHHPPLVVAPDGSCWFADSGEESLPLGMGSAPTEAVRAWQPGDRMLFYTDGLAEARDAAGVFFPLDRHAPALGSGSPGQALDGLVGQVLAHAGDELGDDMALVLAERHVR